MKNTNGITGGIGAFDEEKLKEIVSKFQKEQKRMYAIHILRRAIRYVEGYLQEYRINTESDFSCENPWIKIQVIIEEKN